MWRSGIYRRRPETYMRTRGRYVRSQEPQHEWEQERITKKRMAMLRCDEYRPAERLWLPLLPKDQPEERGGGGRGEAFLADSEENENGLE
jgi:hypothetical protein